MKRIVVDARMVKAEGHGIGNYVLQMAEGLEKISKSYELLYLVDEKLPALHPLRRLRHKNAKTPFLHKLEPWRLAKEIAALKPSLYHTPSFASLRHYPCPYVQTVHDLNHLHFGSFAQRMYYAWILLPSLRRARCIIAVSGTAAGEIKSWLKSQGLQKEIAVVENAILPFAPGEVHLGKWNLNPGSYFLCVSNNKPFKNVAMLKAAYSLANVAGNLPPLVISTSGATGSGIIHTGALADAELATLLSHASRFFFPSLYEGFGRPPLEAALAGTPPVAADIPVLREVLRGVKEAVFLNPQDQESWEKAFLTPAPPRVSAESQTWISQFYSAEKLAEAMHQIYSEALASS